MASAVARGSFFDKAFKGLSLTLVGLTAVMLGSLTVNIGMNMGPKTRAARLKTNQEAMEQSAAAAAEVPTSDTRES